MSEIRKEIFTIEAFSKETFGIKIGENWYNLNKVLTKDFKDAVTSVFSDLGRGDKVELTGDLDKKEYNVIEIKEKSEKKDSFGDIVHFEDLMKQAHEKGMTGIKTKLISVDWEKKHALFKAIVTGPYNAKLFGCTEFQAHGDATQENVDSDKVRKHFIRMAETRAISRAIRWFLAEKCTDVETETGDAEGKKSIVIEGKEQSELNK